MEVKASVKYIRSSSRKTGLVLDAIRGLSVPEALDQLKFINKKVVGSIEKLINSATANAEHNFELEKTNLFIKEIQVNEGPTLKRWKPRARGRATPIRKRTSHINLVLGELVESGKTGAKKQKIDAPVKLGKEPQKDEGVKVKSKKDESPSAKATEDEKGKNIVDPRGEGKGKNTRIEGKNYSSKPGFMSKIFRRKSG